MIFLQVPTVHEIDLDEEGADQLQPAHKKQRVVKNKDTKAHEDTFNGVFKIVAFLGLATGGVPPAIVPKIYTKCAQVQTIDFTLPGPLAARFDVTNIGLYFFFN